MYDTDLEKPRAPQFRHYLGERTWFNKPKKGNGEGFAGLSPSQLSTVEGTHPLMHKQRMTTMKNFNPREDIKPNSHTNPPGLDPGRYPSDN